MLLNNKIIVKKNTQLVVLLNNKVMVQKIHNWSLLGQKRIHNWSLFFVDPLPPRRRGCDRGCDYRGLKSDKGTPSLRALVVDPTKVDGVLAAGC